MTSGHRAVVIVVILGTAAAFCGCSVLSGNCPPQQPPAARVRYEHAQWSQVTGWGTDEVKEAWPAFLKSCSAVGTRTEWAAVCAAAQGTEPETSAAIRAFFERYFEPYSVLKEIGRRRENAGLITGYYEPLLLGARSPSARFNTALYSPPPDLLTVDLSSLYPELKGKRVRARLRGNTVVPYYSRAELATDPGPRGNEIVWVENRLDAFLLEVQGSGRVQLPDGVTIRLQYADQNGQPYRSIGHYLVERGELTLAEATLSGIQQWVAAHPERLQELLDANPSVVFFREEPLPDPTQGPKGSLGVPLTAGRSIAVDPASAPLGAPVFLATTLPGSELPLQRLVIAQDTGGAIRGAVRADFFWGVGAKAAEQAGRMRQSGRIWLLWPKDVALPPN
jgi:membrane-bound lytic murein transglycosylase A